MRNFSAIILMIGLLFVFSLVLVSVALADQSSTKPNEPNDSSLVPLEAEISVVPMSAAGTSYCSQPNLAIPDNDPTGVQDTMAVLDTGELTDVDIYLNVAHTWVGDLVFTMTHETSGTSLVFYDRPGVPTSTFGCSGNDIDATINDEGTNGNLEDTCIGAVPAIAGELVGGDPPDNALLATFDGLSLDGNWTLTVSDYAGGDTGTLVEWCLIADALTSPNIGFAPSSLNSSQPSNTQMMQTLTISNMGYSDLDWSILEAPSFTLAASDGNFSRGNYAPSAGMAPIDGVGVISPDETRQNLAPSFITTAYSWNSQNGPYYTVFDLGIPEVLPTIATFDPGTFVGAGDYIEGSVIMIDSSNMLHAFAPDGTQLYSVPIAPVPPNGETFSGLAYDPTSGVVYGSTTNVSTSSLFIINVTTGATSLIGPITNSPANIALAIDGSGQMYGYDITTDLFMSINKVTGFGTNIGPLGFDANFGQGMTWDEATDEIVLTAFNNGTFQAELRVADRTTGNTSLVGTLGATTPGGLNQLTFLGVRDVPECANPGDVSWLSMNPMNGSVSVGGTQDVSVTFDATGLAYDVYTATLCISSNDPVNLLTAVPVTLTVTPHTQYLPFITKSSAQASTYSMPDGRSHNQRLSTLSLAALPFIMGLYLPLRRRTKSLLE